MRASGSGRVIPTGSHTEHHCQWRIGTLAMIPAGFLCKARRGAGMRPRPPREEPTVPTRSGPATYLRHYWVHPLNHPNLRDGRGFSRTSEMRKLKLGTSFSSVFLNCGTHSIKFTTSTTLLSVQCSGIEHTHGCSTLTTVELQSFFIFPN